MCLRVNSRACLCHLPRGPYGKCGFLGGGCWKHLKARHYQWHLGQRTGGGAGHGQIGSPEREEAGAGDLWQEQGSEKLPFLPASRSHVRAQNWTRVQRRTQKTLSACLTDHRPSLQEATGKWDHRKPGIGQQGLQEALCL